MSTQGLLYSVGCILFFDLIVLASLIYYQRKLEYSYLKFGAVAMGAEILAQIAFFAWANVQTIMTLAVIGGIAKFSYAVLMLVGFIHIAGREVPFKFILTVGIFYLGHLVFWTLWGQDVHQHWLISQLFPGILLAAGIYYLLVKPSYFPRYLLACALVVHVLVNIALPLISVDTGMFLLAYLFNSLVVMILGVLLLMISSDQMVATLRDSAEMLQEYRLENERLELQFAQAQKLESLGVLAGGIAHDFNNMLTSILGYASLAMNKLPASSEVRKDLYMVMSGARQAVDLTSQMLIYAGKGAVEFESVDLSGVVDNMTSLINSIVPRKIQLVQRVARDLPHVKGDQVQLGQVLMNLVANAVEAIDKNPGTIEISTGLAELDETLLSESFLVGEASTGAYLYISVKDTGVGMEADQIAKIFDPFYSEKGVSKGLGLSSISGIVRQHKGFVKVRSTPGQGSEFTVYFPALTYHQEVAPRTGQPFRAHSGQDRGHILLADDDPRIRSLIQSILESEHFQLTTAEDGREAMKLAGKNGADYELFLLDCTMPKMSGTEVYQQIRSLGSKTPVILISGYHQEQVISNISNDANAYFIKKPFNVDELVDRVNQALSERVSLH